MSRSLGSLLYSMQNIRERQGEMVAGVVWVGYGDERKMTKKVDKQDNVNARMIWHRR